MGINIRPLAAKKTTSSLSTVLKPEGFNFGRGTAYVASEDVAEGDELLSLPMSQVMTVNSAARGRVGLLLEVNPDLPPVITLSLHLLEERALGPFSNFSNFVSMLPAIGDINSTMFYSEDQLKELEGSQLLLHTLGRAQAAEAFYDALFKPVTSREAVDPPIFKEQDFTLENFRWALGVVWATAFQTGENETDVVLAPILDTIGICTEEGNESCLPPRITVDSNERLVVYASSTYTKGQEVRLSMPGKSSVQLMLNHGFARAEAVPKLDKMDLTVTLDPSDPLAPMKGYLLQTQLNESVNTTYAFFYGITEIDEAIATSLKMKLLSGVELPRYKELLAPKEENDQERRILSLHNEFVFTRAIISTCTTLLGYYPTTIEQDEGIVAELTGKNDFQSIQKIHVQRTLIMEKQILKKTMDIALEDWKNLVFSSSPSLQD
eukprot:jgi/Phyca11/563593/estExt2_Genewise1.C_PHYCAscaffold_120589